jgi:hypothetical protein
MPRNEMSDHRPELLGDIASSINAFDLSGDATAVSIECDKYRDVGPRRGGIKRPSSAIEISARRSRRGRGRRGPALGETSVMCVNCTIGEAMRAMASVPQARNLVDVMRCYIFSKPYSRSARRRPMCSSPKR